MQAEHEHRAWTCPVSDLPSLPRLRTAPPLVAGFQDVQASLGEFEGSLSTTRAGAYGGAARASVGALVFNQPLGNHLSGKGALPGHALCCLVQPNAHTPHPHIRTCPVSGTQSESESLSSTSAGVARAESTAGSGLPVRGEACWLVGS